MSNRLGLVARAERQDEEGAALSLHAMRPAPGVQELRAQILSKLAYSVGKDPAGARDHDWLTAAILVLRDGVVDGWMQSIREAKAPGASAFIISRLNSSSGACSRTRSAMWA